MDVTIYQINLSRDQDCVAFLNYENTQKGQKQPGINSSIYDKVYTGSFDKTDLDEIYHIFNMKCPEDFYGHSLSVSDIVEISVDPSKESEFYFCDSIGFKRVDFEPEKTQDFPMANFEPKRKPEFYHLEARLGIGLKVTPQEFEILKRGDGEAHKLLASLVQSDRCVMGGDTYFPQPWNEEYLEDDLNFDLPSKPLYPQKPRTPSLDEHFDNEFQKIDNPRALYSVIDMPSGSILSVTSSKTGPFLCDFKVSNGDPRPLRSQIQEIGEGDAFIAADGAIHCATEDAHQNLDEPDKPWVVYDEYGGSWFAEDIIPAEKGISLLMQAQLEKRTGKPSLDEVINNANSKLSAKPNVQNDEKER